MEVKIYLAVPHIVIKNLNAIQHKDRVNIELYLSVRTLYY